MTALATLSRPAEHDEDRDLVARVRAGDERAFESLFVRYQPRIAAFVRSRLRDHGRAEDITQEVFISALRRLRETDTEIAFKPWIYEIAKNACIDAWRRSRNTDEISFDEQDALGADDHGRLAQPALTPDSAIDVKLAFDDLRGALGGLDQNYHDLLVLREFEGRSYAEIGDRLGMSRASVESSLFRARQRLGEEYQDLVSGEACRRVQGFVEARGARAAGVRAQRRMAKHVAHCQPCRRYAAAAGVDLDVARRPAAAIAARIAGLLPWPLFGRRRAAGDAGPGVAPAQSAQIAQWTSSVATTLDPAAASGLSKMLATAAAVAVAGVGAGAAIHERHAIEGLFGGARGEQRQPAAERPGATAAPGSPSAARTSPAAGTGSSSTGALVGGEPAGGAGGGGATSGTSQEQTTAGGGEARSGGAPARQLPATPNAGGDRGGVRAPAVSAGPTAPAAPGEVPAAPRPQELTGAISPTADTAIPGGAPQAAGTQLPRPQAPAPPSAQDVTGPAGSVTSGAPAVPSPPALPSPRVAGASDAVSVVGAAAPAGADTLATAGRTAP